MTVALTINGTTYDYPETGDVSWGPDATDWASAVTTGMLQKAGGTFQLLAEVDFGTSYGIKSLYYKSRTSNVASAGQVRLARADVISFRNEANSANLDLGVNSSNVLTFNGVAVGNFVSVSDTSTIDLTLSAGVLTADIVAGSITNTMISNSAAIAYSKLATLTSGNILVGSAGNVATSVAMSGDATIIASGALTIANSAVTNAKMANMANTTFKGNISGGSAAPSDLTATQVTANLNAFVGDSGAGGTKGLVPAPSAGDAAADKFLKADGTWTSPSGAGDVVGPASSVSGQIARFGDTSGKLLTATPSTISNSDVNASAAIEFSKLESLGNGQIIIGSVGSVPTARSISGDVTLSATGVVDLVAGAITNTDINAAAAISLSKLATLTASRAIVTDGGGILVAATTTASEIGFVNGVTSAIQTQLDAKQLRSTLTTKGDLYVATASNTVTRLGAGTNGYVLTANSSQTEGLQYLPPNNSSSCLINVGLAASVAASAMTISLKTSSGSDASSTDPIFVGFRNATSATGQYSLVSVTGALSTVISSGSTAGQVSGLSAYIYVYLINNSGTAELAWSRVPLDCGTIVTTTAEGGAGGADSNRVVYSTTARSNVPVRMIGRLLNTQATAGTWASAPTEISLTPFDIIPLVARYKTGSGQTINNATTTTINFDTRVVDNYNCVTTGASWVFVAPWDGYYLVTSLVNLAGATGWDTGNTLQLRTYKAGAENAQLGYMTVCSSDGTASSLVMGEQGTDIVQMNAGDNLYVRINQGSGAAINLSADDQLVYVSICCLMRS